MEAGEVLVRRLNTRITSLSPINVQSSRIWSDITLRQGSRLFMTSRNGVDCFPSKTTPEWSLWTLQSLFAQSSSTKTVSLFLIGASQDRRDPWSRLFHPSGVASIRAPLFQKFHPAPNCVLFDLIKQQAFTFYERYAPEMRLQ
jgi:hypothetical protein